MATKEIFQAPSGRYIIATWSERQAQYQGHVAPAPWQGYIYSYARSLQGLADLGVPTYRTLAAARAAYGKAVR